MKIKLILLPLLCAILFSCDKELIYPNNQNGEAPLQPEGLIAGDFEVKAIPADMILEYNMDPSYYFKYTRAWGIPIVASNEVADIYLQNAAELVCDMLSDENLVPAIAVKVRNLLFQNMLRIVLFPDNGKRTTQVPEFKMLAPADGYGALADDCPVMAMGVGNVSECSEGLFQNDHGRTKRGNTLPHELMHSIHAIAADKLLPGFSDKLKEAYQNAQSARLWYSDLVIVEEGIESADLYINTNYEEYLAEGTEVWFNWQPYLNPDDDSFIKQKDLKSVDPQLYEVLSLIFQPNEEAMEHLSFASPKVIISIEDLHSLFGYDYSDLTIELFGSQEIIGSQNLYGNSSATTFIMPDPTVSYISFDHYKFKATIRLNNGEQVIKEYAFSKEELADMEGFPSDINLTETWRIVD